MTSIAGTPDTRTPTFGMPVRLSSHTRGRTWAPVKSLRKTHLCPSLKDQGRSGIKRQGESRVLLGELARRHLI